MELGTDANVLIDYTKTSPSNLTMVRTDVWSLLSSAGIEK